MSNAKVPGRARGRAKAGAGQAYLIFVTGGAESEQYLLTDVASEEFMGERCIRGYYETPGGRQHYMSRRVFRIPLARIQLIIEYESRDAYRDAVKRHYEEKSK